MPIPFPSPSEIGFIMPDYETCRFCLRPIIRPDDLKPWLHYESGLMYCLGGHTIAQPKGHGHA